MIVSFQLSMIVQFSCSRELYCLQNDSAVGKFFLDGWHLLRRYSIKRAENNNLE